MQTAPSSVHDHTTFDEAAVSAASCRQTGCTFNQLRRWCAQLTFLSQSALPRTQCRSKHTPPTWTDHQKQDRFANNGVPGFLSANAYQETYAKYSQYLCDKLTEYTQGAQFLRLVTSRVGTRQEYDPLTYLLQAHPTNLSNPETSTFNAPTDRNGQLSTTMQQWQTTHISFGKP